MEMYLFKSALILFIFFVFYKGVLEHTSLHTLKRFYLLGALILAFGIPFVTITSYVEVASVTSERTPSILADTLLQDNKMDLLPSVLWTIYGIGVFFFGWRFFRNISTMIEKIRSNPKMKNKSVINVLLREKVVPHTFLNYIFLYKKHFVTNAIPAEVIEHEITHAREKHSLDVLFVELLGVVFWFNPLFYFIRRAIKLNHEFLADRSVLNTGVDPITYQNIVLAFSSNAQTPILANSINYSFTRLNEMFLFRSFGQVKKRFTVMRTNTSKGASWLRSMLLLPLLAIVLFSFSSRETIEVEAEMFQEEISFQDSASREEMKEYTKLAKKYNAMDKGNLVIKKKDLQRLEYIYHKMSSKQRADAEPFPNIPPPPPPPAADAPNPPGAPKVVKGVNDINAPVPPPPPPPPAPESVLDHIVRMAKKGATFYYEGKLISSDEAIALIKSNEHLNINSKRTDSGKPEVRISAKGFKHN